MGEARKTKERTVGDYVKLIQDYPIIGAVDMENMPAPQLQSMRKQLKETVVLRMAKKRLLKLAIEQAKGKKAGVEKLLPYLKGHPAMLFTKENPFKLYKTLEKNKSNAPAKPGQTAPKDIVVPAGPTGFSPGPIIGELGMIGIKTGIEGGKVAIKQDSVVVKAGEIIKPNVASLLMRLKVEPMEVGLDLVAVYEHGEIFTKEVLGVDDKVYAANIVQAYTWSINLGVNAGIYNETTTEIMLQKAYNDAKGLAIEQNILADAVVGNILAKAEAHMLALKAEVPQ